MSALPRAGRHADLVVVGGGPAGSALAALAASAGVRTLVVERKRFPRDKVCGEFVSAAGCAVLDRLGILERLRSAGAPEIGRCRITEALGAGLDLELPEAALGVSRSRLDAALLDHAARRGAVVLEGWEAAEPLVEHGRVGGVRLRDAGRSRSSELRASVVVAADGRRSALARALHARPGDPRHSGTRSWFGLKTHLDGCGALGERVELHLFDGGYAGLAPVEGGRTNLCLIVTVSALRACGGSPDRLLAERIAANPAARDALDAGRRSTPWRSVGPLRFNVRRPAAAGVLFVGDAAGTIDPFCGQGIAHALLGAELALPFAIRAAARGALTDDLAAAYARSWRRTFLPVTRRARRLGRVFERPRLARPLLRVLAGSGRALAPRIAAATRTGGPA